MNGDSRTPQEERDAWIAGIEALAALYRANPALRTAGGAGGRFPFTIWLHGSPSAQRAELAAWEAVLDGVTAHVRGTAEADDPDGTYYDLDGEAGGLRVRVRAFVRRVAERKVTSTRTVEDVEWVRLPAGDAAPESEAAQ